MDESLDRLPSDVRTRLVEAIAGLSEGRLTPDCARLENDLKQYPAARRLFVSICLQRSLLSEYFSVEGIPTPRDYTAVSLGMTREHIEADLDSLTLPGLPHAPPPTAFADGRYLHRRCQSAVRNL